MTVKYEQYLCVAKDKLQARLSDVPPNVTLLLYSMTCAQEVVRCKSVIMSNVRSLDFSFGLEICTLY